MSTKGKHWVRLDSCGDGNVSKRPEVRKKLSSIAKRRWRNAESRKVMMAAHARALPRKRITVRRSWQDPEVRAKRITGLTKALTSDAYRLKQSKIRKALLSSSPAVKKAWLAAIKLGLQASQKPEVMARRLVALAAVKKTEKWKQSHKAGLLRAYAEGKFDYLPLVGGLGKKEHFCSKKTGKTIFCHSSWESLRVRAFERDAAIVTYRKDPVRIPYSLNGRAHYYVPDFLIEYLDGRHVLEELKPAFNFIHKREEVTAKFTAAKQFCKQAGLQFRILTTVGELGTV